MIRFELTETDGCAVCRPVGELDALTVDEFREQLAAFSTATDLVIDLSEVPFMDSAGLGALIGGIRRLREAGGSVGVACNRPAVLRLLHTTGFDRIVTVSPSVEEAVAELARAGPESG